MRGERNGDKITRTYFRSDRMMRDGDGWYFTTREGNICGPYATREGAEKDLEEYIAIMAEQRAGMMTLKPRATELL